MKILEIRRHSIRAQPGNHLNQQGVTLARSVGQTLGPFGRVVTSTLSRAFETAIAMGFAVDEQNELMSTYGGQVGREAPWPMPFYHYSEVVKRNGAATAYANQLADYYAHVISLIADGEAALAINHGGVVELGVAACLPNEDFLPWGDEVGYCEGARLFWEDGKFIRGEVLRVGK
jgi:broad specificity phosphatase PhoE